MSPIKAENKAKYPHDWPDISRRIKERAGWRCECEGECGSSHRGRCQAHHGDQFYLSGRVRPRKRPVCLTTAHLDHDPANNADSNLRAYCEGCHNRYDRPHRNANARRTRETKAGLTPLSGEGGP